MKVRQLSFLLILASKSLFAQDINSGSRITSMGNTGVAIQEAWSLQSNPAGIAALHTPVMGVTYQKNFPGTSLSTESAIFVYPMKKHAFGLGIQSFGFSAYKELRLGFAYARKFGESVYSALNFNYHQLSIPAYGSTRTYSIDGGFQYRFSNELILGAHVSNLSNSSYDQTAGAVIPVYLAIGSSYRFSEELLLCTSLCAGNNDSGGDFRCGVEYCLLDQLALRAGLAVHPFSQYAGFGYMLKHIHVDLAVNNHLILGYNPQISLGYVF